MLHTFQHPSVWSTLVRQGIYRAERWDQDHELAEAYRWMHRQMNERLPVASNGIVWWWAQNARRGVAAMRPEPGYVLLACRVPRQDVLVSHFEDWHCVLNRSPLIPSLPGEDDEAYGRRLDPLLDYFFDRRSAAGSDELPVDAWPDDSATTCSGRGPASSRRTSGTGSPCCRPPRPR